MDDRNLIILHNGMIPQDGTRPSITKWSTIPKFNTHHITIDGRMKSIDIFFDYLINGMADIRIAPPLQIVIKRKSSFELSFLSIRK